MLAPELVKPGAARPPAAPSIESALEVLERFGLSLQQCEQSRDQVRLTLDAVRDALSADAALWFPGPAADGFEVAGADLSAAWAREFLRRAAPPSCDRAVQ